MILKINHAAGGSKLCKIRKQLRSYELVVRNYRMFMKLTEDQLHINREMIRHFVPPRRNV